MSKPGKWLQFLMTAAIIAAASWYVLPGWIEDSSDPEGVSVSVVTTDDVNLRAGPGTSFHVISVVPKGTEVTAEANEEAGFVLVRVSGDHGWMSTAFLSAPGSVFARSHAVEAMGTEALSHESDAVVESVEERAEFNQPPEPISAPTYVPVVAQSAEVETAREAQPGEKWIEVDRSTRTVTLHNGEIVVARFSALIGKDPSADGYYSTATGTFYVHVMEKSLVETPFAEGVFLTDFVGFDPERSNGFHSPVRDEYGNVVQTGGTSTLGCVRLAESDAILLFNFAHMGMRVEVHD